METMRAQRRRLVFPSALIIFLLLLVTQSVGFRPRHVPGRLTQQRDKIYLAPSEAIHLNFFSRHSPSAGPQRALSDGGASMSWVMSALLTLVIRGFIGAFNPLKSEVAVKVAASSNINALLGRWKSLYINVGPDVGLFFPVHSFKATGTQLDVGVIPARLLLLLITLATGNVYILLVNLFISTKSLGSPLKPSHVDWTLSLSSRSLNGGILRPFMQSVLDSLMSNSVLTAALLSHQAISNISVDKSKQWLQFYLNKVLIKDGGIEFDSNAVYRQDVNSADEMNLNFKLKTKIKCDQIGGNGLVFVEPGIRTDFTEVIENTLAQVRSPIGKSFLKAIVPKDPVTYMPVGAAVILSLPCRVVNTKITAENEVEINGRVDFNEQQACAAEGTPGLLPTLPASTSRSP